MIFSTLAVFSSAVIAAPTRRYYNPDEFRLQNLRDEIRDKKCEYQWILETRPTWIKVFNCLTNMSVRELDGNFKKAEKDCKKDSKWEATKKTADEKYSKCSGGGTPPSRYYVGDMKELLDDMREGACDLQFTRATLPTEIKISNCVLNMPPAQYTHFEKAKAICENRHNWPEISTKSCLDREKCEKEGPKRKLHQ